MEDGSHGGEKDISGWSSWTREIIAKGGHSPREIFEKKKAKRVEEGARAMSQKAYYINRLEEEKNRVARGEYPNPRISKMYFNQSTSVLRSFQEKKPPFLPT